MIKKIMISSVSIISLLLFTTPAFAHVIVYPHQTGIGESQVFDMSVPTEKDVPTVEIKLLIPEGLQEVVPNAKTGWTINIKKNGDTVTEIDWTGGNIPPEERDDFYFSAQAPTKKTILKWRAYQKYQDGSIINWDHTPTSNPEDDSAPPPYSTTMVINDLTQSTSTNQTQDGMPLLLSSIAITFSLISLGFVLRKKD